MKTSLLVAILPSLTLSQGAYANPITNCSGSACSALSTIAEPPGVGAGNFGLTLVNSSNRQVTGSVTWFFGGCNKSGTGFSLPPNGRVHSGNNGYCNVTANFVTPPQPAHYVPPPPSPVDPAHAFCNGPGMVVTFTSCTGNALAGSVTVATPAGQSDTKHVDVGANPPQCGDAGYQAAAALGLKAQANGAALTVCGKGNAVTVVNGTSTKRDF
jgi:hypothetical protein